MKEIEDKGITGFILNITDEIISVHMPIENLKNGFELSPRNYSEVKVIKGKEQEFAEWLVRNLLDQADSETGDSFLVTMLDDVFERAYEGAESFVDYGDEE